MTVATRYHTIIWQLLSFKNLTYSCKNLTSDDLTKFLLLWSGWAELCQGMTSLSRAVVPRSICSPKNHFAPWHTMRREAEKLSNEREKKIKFIISGLLKSVHIHIPIYFLCKAKSFLRCFCGPGLWMLLEFLKCHMYNQYLVGHPSFGSSSTTKITWLKKK